MRFYEKINEEISNKFWNYVKNIPDDLNQANWILISKHHLISLKIIEENINNYPFKWCWGISQNPNITWEFVLANIEKDWNWGYLAKSKIVTWEIVIDLLDNNKELYEKLINNNLFWISMNPNITIDIVNKYNNIPWNICGLSSNPNINLNIIKKHSYINWNFWNLSNNLDLDFSFIEKNINNEWNWEIISQNRTVSPEIILRYFYKRWNWEYVQKYKFVDFDFKKYLHLIVYIPKNHSLWTFISKNSSIDLNFITNNNLPWDWNIGISKNPNLTFDFVLKNLNEKWNWYTLASHKIITWEIIKDCIDNRGILYDKLIYNKMYSISINPNINWEIINNNKYIDWNWDGISNNPNIDINIIKNNINNKWNWECICDRHALDWDIIDNNKNINWNFWRLTSSNRINISNIFDNVNHDWNWPYVIKNKFDKNEIICIKYNFLRRWLASKVIQRNFRIARYNPNYAICKKILIESYYELFPQNR